MLGTAAGLTLNACDDDPSGPFEPVRIGYIEDFAGASLMAIANHTKLWAEHGLAPLLYAYPNGPTQVKALQAGQLDFGYLGPGALWLPATGQARIVAVSSLGGADRVVSRPEFRTIGELRGRAVGVPAGTSGDMILRLALKRHGLEPADVKKISLEPAAMATAFRQRKIDAAGIWHPWVDTIRDEGIGLQILSANDDFYPEMTFLSAYVGRNEVVRDNPGLVRKVVGLIRSANKRRADDKGMAVEMTSLLLNASISDLRKDAAVVQLLTTEKIAEFSANGTVHRWLSGLNSLFVEMGRLDSRVDPDTYYDSSFYAE
jgi:NitT/TauT family transport system substrate-binding protein